MRATVRSRHVTPLGFGFPAGNYGVNLFFHISGFVIFMTLERSRNAMDFMVSRCSRLYPAYWTGLAVAAIVIYTAEFQQSATAIQSTKATHD
ncbi:MAG: acyltransferase family protein [Pseudoxanthomonas sp.]